jgi:uncharacterized FlaG/YvyC family protein
MGTTAFYEYSREVEYDVTDEDGDVYTEVKDQDLLIEYEYSFYNDDYYGKGVEIDVVKVTDTETKAEVKLTPKETLALIQGPLTRDAYDHDSDARAEAAWAD